MTFLERFGSFLSAAVDLTSRLFTEDQIFRRVIKQSDDTSYLSQLSFVVCSEGPNKLHVVRTIQNFSLPLGIGLEGSLTSSEVPITLGTFDLKKVQLRKNADGYFLSEGPIEGEKANGQIVTLGKGDANFSNRLAAALEDAKKAGEAYTNNRRPHFTGHMPPMFKQAGR